MSNENPVSNELYRASWDSFLFAVLLALWGVASFTAGSYLIGGVQLLASFLNFSTGFSRRNMASKITLTSDTTAEADKQSDA